jgi:hypothetical protein
MAVGGHTDSGPLGGLSNLVLTLPLLPIQYQPLLRAEDVTERLERRIVAIAPKAAHVALDETVSPVEVIRLLGDSP